MHHTIKDLQAQGYSKTLIYEVLKNVWTVSKQFVKNKRVFDEKDIEIFKHYKVFGSEKTVLKYSTSQKPQKDKTVLKLFQTVGKRHSQKS